MTLKNTKENAIISVVSVQKAGDMRDEGEFITRGTFYARGNKYYIFYNESEEMGMANCSVMLIADKNTVTMRRNGEYELKLFYKEGESQNVIYYMPFGEINMSQTTHKVRCDLSDSGGVIKLFYTLCIGVDEQENELTIKVERNNGRIDY